MKIDWIEGISIIGIGVVIWYIVDQTKKGRSKMKLGKAPQSPADCPKGTRFDTFGTCLAIGCPPAPPNKCTPIQQHQDNQHKQIHSPKITECNRKFNNWYSPSFGGATKVVYQSAFVKGCNQVQPCPEGQSRFPQYSGVRRMENDKRRVAYGQCTDIRNYFEKKYIPHPTKMPS